MIREGALSERSCSVKRPQSTMTIQPNLIALWPPKDK